MTVTVTIAAGFVLANISRRRLNSGLPARTRTESFKLNLKILLLPYPLHTYWTQTAFTESDDTVGIITWNSEKCYAAIIDFSKTPISAANTPGEDRIGVATVRSLIAVQISLT